MKKPKLITNPMHVDTDQKRQELEKQFASIRERIEEKAKDGPKYILADGVMLGFLERVLNEEIPENYFVSEIMHETVMVKNSALVGSSLVPVVMYYVLMQRN